MIVTLSERRAKEVDRLRSAAGRALAELSAYALEQGGRFVVFGSFARGDIIPESDLDLLVDFPISSDRRACAFAEATCRRLGLKPDVHLAAESSDALLQRVKRDGLVLP